MVSFCFVKVSFRDGKESFRNALVSFHNGEVSFHGGEASFRNGKVSFRNGEVSFHEGKGTFMTAFQSPSFSSSHFHKGINSIRPLMPYPNLRDFAHYNLLYAQTFKKSRARWKL